MRETPRNDPPVGSRHPHSAAYRGHASASAAVPPAEAILPQMAAAFVTSRLYFLVAEIGLPDLLAEGPRTVDYLARRTQVDRESLYRVLRLLATLGVFTEVAHGTFDRTDRSDMMRTWQVWRCFLELPRVVATGRTGMDLAFGTSLWEYLEDNREEAAIFNRMMAFVTQGECEAVEEAYDWSDCSTILDVGGGLGNLLTIILARNPHLSGILFERAQTIDQSLAMIDASGLSERCRVEPGDFTIAVPSFGADVMILSHIVHDWNDEGAVRILGHCRAAMKSGQVLLVVEPVLEPGNNGETSKLGDVLMMLLTGGRERSELEYSDLLKRAGFDLRRIIPLDAALPLGSSVIVATPDGDVP